MSDLIRREDAIKATWGDDINPSEDGMVFEAQSHIDRDIRLIPSADKSGAWITVWDECGENEDGYECSECGAKVDEKFPNCPYCRAKMKGAYDETRNETV